MSVFALSLSLSVALAATPEGCLERYPGVGPAPRERGMALGLFSMEPSFDYTPLVDEIASLGASHVSLVWVWWQDGLTSTEIYPKEGWTATPEQLRGAIRASRRRGLHVTVFPIARLVRPGPGEWRGKLAPADEDAWWRSYDAYIETAAAIADEEGAERLSVGSELLTREAMRTRWLRLTDRLRLAHPGLELMYSANWDHYRPVRFWDLVDVVGLTGYWEVGRGRGRRPEDLVGAWAAPLTELRTLAGDVGRPVTLTEVGYPSLLGGLSFPWDETRDAPVSMEEQRMGLELLAEALSGEPAVGSVYIWNWFGFGGPDDSGYTPRGKPGAELIACWYGAAPGGAPSAFAWPARASFRPSSPRSTGPSPAASASKLSPPLRLPRAERARRPAPARP